MKHGVTWGWIGAALLVTLAGLSIGQVKITSAAMGWTTPAPVAMTTGLSEKPALAIGGSLIHVVWEESVNDHWEIYHSLRESGSWSAWASVGIGEGPALAAEASGDLHLVWYDFDETTHNYILNYRTWTAGSGWGLTYNIWSTGDWLDYPAIAIGPDQVRHVVWQQNLQIYYASSADGVTWTGGPIPGAAGDFPDIAYAGGRIHVVWESSLPQTGTTEIFYAQKSGAGWSDPVLVSSMGEADATAPRILVSASGVVHVVWEEGLPNTQIYYSHSTDSGWITPENVSQAAESVYAPALALDSKGKVHVVWTDSITVFYRSRAPDTGLWDGVVDIASDPNNTYNPLLVPALGVDAADRPHAVWNQMLTGNSDIYYTYRTDVSETTTPSPTISATATATPTSPVTPGQTATATATPTQTATATPTSPVTPGQTATATATPTQTATATPTGFATSGPSPTASPTRAWTPNVWVYLPLLARQ